MAASCRQSGRRGSCGWHHTLLAYRRRLIIVSELVDDRQAASLLLSNQSASLARIFGYRACILAANARRSTARASGFARDEGPPSEVCRLASAGGCLSLMPVYDPATGPGPSFGSMRQRGVGACSYGAGQAPSAPPMRPPALGSGRPRNSGFGSYSLIVMRRGRSAESLLTCFIMRQPNQGDNRKYIWKTAGICLGLFIG